MQMSDGIDPERERLNEWLRRRHESAFRDNLVEGTRLLTAGKPMDALPLLQRAYKLKPDDVDAAINLSGAYLMAGKPRHAIPVLEAAARIAPDNVQVWINLGAAYLGNRATATEERQQRALAAFYRALDLDPLAHSVAYNIGLIYQDRGEIELAIAAFRRAVLADPNDRDARRMLERMQARAARPDN
ncbi:MAG: tetratricopeptide repeat protein [Anaerolineae bacterium]|nr:tetratricopeptide repeat protein [Thermoflexales bacterium]MDW8394803.1 tetratricopeptide repeat protein [Anaerolineae bacterium]